MSVGARRPGPGGGEPATRAGDGAGGTDPILAALVGEGSPGAFVAAFRRMAAAAKDGPRYLREDTVEPVREAPRLPEDGPPASADDLARTVAITMNGGLGTTMGMRAPKALLPVAEGMTLLDIVLKRAESVGVMPLLMNSFATDRAVRAALGGREVAAFLQHRAPKLRRSDFTPVRVPGAPELEWCPPGHADLYTALAASGWLRRLLDRGFRVAFLSNVDNAAASPDPVVLGYFLESGAPFLMEIVRRDASDWKGGHIARRRADGRLVLRDTAQCAPEDEEAFRDPGRHSFFNTNNLWVRLDALAEALERGGGFLPLPTIVNPKTANPRDPRSTPVFHLEQTVGSAIELFEDAAVVEVPRGRFVPVKTTENLLVLRSDIYEINENGRVRAAKKPPPVALDAARYGFVSDLESRFPHGPPSLLACDRLRVTGDVRFGKRIACEGEVTIHGRPDRAAFIPDGERLTGTIRL